ncbi:hypothetical protein ANOM_011169 [Aspergillus nomiae NRRL 13137]|uniref:Rhodopsin domain-containing protein n=1 Tax=Aspergillus nomiae NRRL (strain ATCC 15546 / NRRL 13137 / CBS 260.88 / M93) TaxID=1509407 RepID=A0A0L1IKJ8_ASPN3|nr:uncharacterized protein ANOM_011169 [Aspergillus nomiae NRRL 13137]KNG80084.1 hypothetical protein ANOM_011169 [Aspergillus nomiae NRRL 13137]
MYPFARELAIESWILYAVGIVVIGCRLVSRRIRLKSWSKLQIDDALMCAIALTFTGVTVTANITARVSSDPIVHEEQPTPHAEALMVWGNKAIFMLEQFALVTIWLVKGCLLIIYNRLTLMMKEHLAVKIVAVYVVISFIVIEVLFLGVWCRPITHYWDLESNDFQCGTYLNHLITTTVFNISSDVMMLCIPLPLFIRSHLPFKQKVAVCAVFSLGGIVILMAALNKYYNFSKLTDPRFLVSLLTDVYPNDLLNNETEMVCRGGSYRGLRLKCATSLASSSAGLSLPALYRSLQLHVRDIEAERTATRSGGIALPFAITFEISYRLGTFDHQPLA